MPKRPGKGAAVFLCKVMRRFATKALYTAIYFRGDNTEAFYRLLQRSDIYRFGQVLVHAGFPTLLHILKEGIGGHGKDGDGASQRVFAAADAAGGFQAVHHRHLHVHQNHIIVAGLHAGKGIHDLLTVGADGAACAFCFQQHLQNLGVDGVILGTEELHAGQGRSGLFFLRERLRLLHRVRFGVNGKFHGGVLATAQAVESLGEIQVQLMGEVQLEVLRSLLAERFGLEVSFGPGGILYKETITEPMEGVGHYEPLRHYAEVHLLLEPLPRGSGMQFAADCREEVLDKNWQRLVLTHLEEKQHLGVLTGAPLTDVKITLLAGKAHLKHTEGGDFRQATYRAVRQGLLLAKSQLLAPWYAFRLDVPVENIGRAMSDIQRMEGSFDPPESGAETATLTGFAPVSTMRSYPMEVVSYTRGRGHLSLTLDGYRPCHNAQEVIAETGYQPEHDLDNPADSVFCAHGAGFVVPWSEVRSHMHVESGWGKAKPARPEVQAAPQRRAMAYRATLEEDAELLKIFERTYGPIKRDPLAAFRPVQKTERPDFAAEQWEIAPEYLLVDGYNIIFAWDELNALAKESLDAARRKLMDILCNYQGYQKCVLILVFDAYRVPGSPGAIEQYHNIHVVYTKEAETADMFIERVTHELGKSRRVRVATSDGMEQVIILGHGALRVSARMFHEEVQNVEKQIRALVQGQA